jgi:HD superfamily phosphodiesterase
MMLFCLGYVLENSLPPDHNGINRTKEINHMIGIVLSKMITYLGSDTKRIHHAMKVYSIACALWDEEAKAKGLTDSDERKETLLLAAILHDIGVHEAERKYDSNEGRFQELEGPPVAEAILEDSGADSRLSARVCYLVGHHHSYHLIDDLDFLILVEAEELVNLEEDYADTQTIFASRQITMKTEGAKKLLDSYILGFPAESKELCSCAGG